MESFKDCCVFSFMAEFNKLIIQLTLYKTGENILVIDLLLLLLLLLILITKVFIMSLV